MNTEGVLQASLDASSTEWIKEEGRDTIQSPEVWLEVSSTRCWAARPWRR